MSSTNRSSTSGHDDVTGIVLTGGRSRRFGSDKAFYRIDENNTMTVRAVSSVRSVMNDVRVSSRKDQRHSDSVPIVIDAVPEAGPLAGISAAFQHSTSTWVFVLACDMPNVSNREIERLLSFRTPTSKAVVPRDCSGRLHPLFACYRSDTATSCNSVLQNGDRSMRSFVESISKLGMVLYPTFRPEILMNVNHVSDLAGLNPTSDTRKERVDSSCHDS